MTHDEQFYYTASDKDTVVLGALRLSKFSPNPTDNASCFEVTGSADEQWLLCSTNGMCPNVWKTELTKLFGGDFMGCPPGAKEKNGPPVKMKTRLELQPLMIQP